MGKKHLGNFLTFRFRLFALTLAVQHVEFFDRIHFEERYYRVPPPPALSHFIDFFWQTDFDSLFKQHPRGFSDALFPHIGYTYMINLGAPFVMQINEKKFEVKTDGFLPRHNSIECFHQPGHCIFGIKFRISPVIFQKKINFSEYREFIFPLSYLIDRKIVDQVKAAHSFEARVDILSTYYESIIKEYPGSLRGVNIVREILDECYSGNDFTTPIEKIAEKHRISSRTLQRYFEAATGISSKKALQIIRIRKAVEHLANSPGDFHYSLYGYYDRSHFYKHLKLFLHKRTLTHLQPHLKLLEGLRQRA